MKALAIDSSNIVMGVSVIDDQNILGEIITNVKKNHSVRLMPAIEQLMKEVVLTPKQLDRIIVAKGPGSYTGVRIGVSIAKTLAWTLKKELVGVSSLEILAQNGRFFNGLIVPLFDARRGQVYTGLYQTSGALVVNVEEDRLCLLEDWIVKLKNLNKKVLFIGNDLSLHKAVIQSVMKDNAVYAETTMNNPRASELARLGMLMDPVENIHSFAPTYLQLAEAEAKWIAAQEGKTKK